MNVEDAGTKVLKTSQILSDIWYCACGSRIIKANVEDKKNRTHKPKLAVMPFSNINNDQEGNYLVDGIVEDLIARFSMIRKLEIVSRRTCF